MDAALIRATELHGMPLGSMDPRDFLPLGTPKCECQCLMDRKCCFENLSYYYDGLACGYKVPTAPRRANVTVYGGYKWAGMGSNTRVLQLCSEGQRTELYVHRKSSQHPTIKVQTLICVAEVLV